MKCPECGLFLRTLETRKTEQWTRRSRMCKNKHKVLTRQKPGQAETIVRLSNFAPSAKPATSLPNPLQSVGSIFAVWRNTEGLQAASTLSE